MRIDPRGAVIIIPKTATDKTISPQGRPIESGTEPIAACTVAFGRYEIIQNIFSLNFKFVPIKQKYTPIDLIAKVKRIRNIAPKPIFKI